jgi:hypothetical protein
MPVVRNIKTGHFYRYHGENIYTNLHTSVRGEIKESIAQNIFKINLEATELFAEYPLVEEMVRRLGLVLEK